MVGVSADTMGQDDDATLSAFREQTGVTFPIGYDRSNSYGQFRNAVATISPYPVDVVIAPDGTIAYISGDYRPDEITAVLDALLP